MKTLGILWTVNTSSATLRVIVRVRVGWPADIQPSVILKLWMMRNVSGGSSLDHKLGQLDKLKWLTNCDFEILRNWLKQINSNDKIQTSNTKHSKHWLKASSNILNPLFKIYLIIFLGSPDMISAAFNRWYSAYEILLKLKTLVETSQVFVLRTLSVVIISIISSTICTS